MSANNHITEQRIYGGLMTVLEACGFQVLRDPTGNHHLVKGTLEGAAAFYKLTVAGADAANPVQSEDVASASALTYPATLTPDLAEIMGMPNFRCAPIAHVYRDAGLANVARKAEAEQAFVIDKLVRFAIAHGADWRKHAQEELNQVRAVYVAKKAAPAPITQERFNEKMDALDAANPAPLANFKRSQPQR